LRGTHGFAEAVNAARVISGDDEREPLMDIVAFEKAIGGKFSATGTVGASVGEQDAEAAGQKQLGISCHAAAVVANAMEQDHGISVALARMKGPGAKGDGV
jgi:hypothetical protein